MEIQLNEIERKTFEELRKAESIKSDEGLDSNIPPVATIKTYTRANTDWEKELKSDEIIENKGGGKTVPLRALRRLTRLAGLIKSYPVSMGNPTDPKGRGMIQVIYMTEYSDGAVFGGVADVNFANTNDDFLKFPTAVAESRAEARAHIKALGIQMLATEEIDVSEGYIGAPTKSNAKIDSQQVTVIETMLEDKKIPAIDLISAIIKDRECFDIHDFTENEGIAAMQWLNDQKSKTSKRDAKKAQLKNEVGEIS